jgi:hypothetical protein
MHRKDAGRYLLVMQWQLGQKDTAALRESFKKIQEVQRDLQPGDVAFDATYHTAWLQLAIGDTAQATQLLDLSLDALPTMRNELLEELPQIATLIRGMALRADLASIAGDKDTARHWAQNVLQLWANADRELQPTVSRMRTIAANAH